MAGIDLLSNVSNALSQRFSPRLARQFNRMAVTGAALKSERGFGKNAAWDVEFSGAGAGSYAEGADVAGGELLVDTLVPATLSWGHYRSAFQVSETQFDAAASSAGSAEAIVKLFDERIMGSGMKLASVINVDLLTGSGTDGSGNPNIVGLLNGSLEASGNYANISRSTYTEWKGNVLANGGIARPLTIDLIEQLDANIFTASGLRPTFGLCSPGVWRKYKGLFEPIRRVEGTGPINHYDTSTSLVMWNGIPILRDKDVPAGKMILVNDRMVSKVFLPSSAMSAEDVFKVEERQGAGGNGDGEVNSLNLPFRIVPLSRNGDSLKFMVKCVLQLKVERPNSMGYISDISEV